MGVLTAPAASAGPATAPAEPTGTSHRPADEARAGLPTTAARLRRLVVATVLLALALQVGVGWVVRGEGATAPLTQAPSWLTLPVLLALLLGLGVVAELYAVRIRHGEALEELTLVEAVVVACALVLPPVPALLVPVLASAISSAVRRRGAMKLSFNAANTAAGSALVVAALHALTSPGAGIGPATALGLAIGMTAFATLNLVLVARVLEMVSDDEPRLVVQEGLRLSAVMALGCTGLGATAVALADAAPALLPFSVLPAAALTFAYRTTQQERDERCRSSRLLALSQVLAGRLEGDEMLAAFLRLTRQAFRADVATALLLFDDDSVLCATDDRVTGGERRQAQAADRVLLTLAGAGAAVLPSSAEHGWTSALAAPLESDGRRLGVVTVATRDRHHRLGAAELTLFTSLVAALAAALRGADHLRRLWAETSKLQAVVDRSSDGIVVLDGDGVVQLWSPAAQALTGLRAYEALGLPLAGLVATSDADGAPVDAFTAGHRLLSPAEPQAVVELSLRRTDGELRVVRCAHAGVFGPDGLLDRDVVLLHDVTREREVERLKADFIATVSHELRTPVTPIKGYADLLRRRGDSMTPERRNECLEVISDRSAHLARLVEDLLLASRISLTAGASAAQVSMSGHDLGALVRRASADFGDDGARLRLHLPAEEVEVACDPLRTVQVVGNLVGNALKYSAPGTPVDVRLTTVRGAALVEVEDRGRGIPADQLDRVFEKFHRVEDPMRMTTGGTGLGLYIASELTRAMGGALSCRSVLGVGSTFVLQLALAAPEADGAQADSAPAVLPRPRPRAQASAVLGRRPLEGREPALRAID
jgi:PAS domain S-box-containing protein